MLCCVVQTAKLPAVCPDADVWICSVRWPHRACDVTQNHPGGGVQDDEDMTLPGRITLENGARTAIFFCKFSTLEQ